MGHGKTAAELFRAALVEQDALAKLVGLVKGFQLVQGTHVTPTDVDPGLMSQAQAAYWQAKVAVLGAGMTPEREGAERALGCTQRLDDFVSRMRDSLATFFL